MIESLECHFKMMSKSLETLIKKESDLSEYSSKLGSSFVQLCESEIHKNISQAFLQIADIQRKCQELYKKQSRITTLCQLCRVEEYIRLISSMRV